MTKITTSLAVDGISGRSTDNVYYQRNGHTYRRKYTAPKEQSGTSQAAIKSIFSAISNEFKFLSNSVKNDWSLKAAELYPSDNFMTGLTLFKQVNWIRRLVQGASITDPALIGENSMSFSAPISATYTQSLVLGEGALEISFGVQNQPVPIVAGNFCTVRITKPGYMQETNNGVYRKDLRLVLGVCIDSAAALTALATQSYTFTEVLNTTFNPWATYLNAVGAAYTMIGIELQWFIANMPSPKMYFPHFPLTINAA